MFALLVDATIVNMDSGLFLILEAANQPDPPKCCLATSNLDA